MSLVNGDTAFYRDVIDQMNDGVYFVDRARNITYWSRGAERLTGYGAAEVVGHACRDGILNHVDESGAPLCGARCPLLATMRDGACREAHVYLHHADGHRRPVWVRSAPMRGPDGEIVGAIEVFSDDSEAATIQQRLLDLQQEALTDPLTGLGNRRFLQMQLDSRVSEWQRYQIPFGVLMIDIDLFKQVNDRHGHDVGDQVLGMVARTLMFGVRGSDVIARFGGEEFVAVLPDSTREEALAVAERIRKAFEEAEVRAPNGDLLELSASVGVAAYEPGESIDAMLNRVDGALYKAKQLGRNRVVQV